MTCGQCGTGTTRAGLCADCATDRYRETGPVGGTGSDEDAAWAVEQQGLGDADPEGQTRLDGGIVKEVAGDE